MKRWIGLAAALGLFFSLAALSCTPPLGEGQPGGPPTGLVMVQEDEFSGTTLNTNLWSTGWFGSGITGPVNDYEEACYDPARVNVGFNVLILDVTDPPGTVHCPKTAGDPNPDREYTSGMISSRNKYSIAPSAGHEVYIEYRIFLECINGDVVNWPAAWSVDTLSGPTGEIDTMEGLGGDAKSTYHGPSGSGNIATFASGCGWHTYGSLWSTDAVTSYYDGVLQGTYNNPSNVTENPQYLILGHQMSSLAGQWGGPVKAPALMYVDHVRVYQRP